MAGLRAASDRAQPTVRSYVRRVYSASLIPADETPSQKKHAWRPRNSAPEASKSKRSSRTISRSFGSVRLVGRLPTARTLSTPSSSRHSRRTPCPTIPVAPKRRTFTGSSPQRLFEGCAGKEAGRVEGGQGTLLGADEKRDLRAGEGDRVAAPVREARDGAVVETPRGVREDAVHQLGEDDPVHLVEVRLFLDDGLDPELAEAIGIHRRSHRVTRAEDPDAAETAPPRLLADDAGDVQPGERRLLLQVVPREVRGVVRTDREVRSRRGE